ncbi:FAD/NAD(P)-binding protein [Yoonia sp.]|uniref:FAD/NAD(P)-binding protein n=1 Tax=Yoonia sp. TaxID=2212373 RepID=UPI00391A813B
MHIAIVGFGPRGLAAAECVLARTPDLRIEIFDPCAVPAAGPNFMPDEPDECLLNLPLRAVDLPPPAGAAGTSFHDFVAHDLGRSPDPDLYPPRNMLGRYLSARLHRLRQRHPDAMTHHAGLVTDAWRDGQGWWLMLADAPIGPFDALLLAPGQPLSRADDQLALWQNFAVNQGFEVTPAYPGRTLTAAATRWAGKTIAIRGLGLSTCDVVAMLSIGLGGKLVDGRYERAGQEPRLIVPFSRDGLPPMPKPALKTELRYALRPREHARLVATIRDAIGGGPVQARQTIAAALAPPATRISGQDADAWLATEVDPEADHPAKDPVAFLQDAIAMAEGRMAPSVEYATGQIWKALQSDLRVIFHETDGDPDTRAAIINIDQGLKRVTYGPPLVSARLLLALVRAGLVRLGLADAPDIALTDQGWVLDADVTAQVMIDAVLPAPKLSQLDDPLIRSLLRKGHLRADPATDGILLGRGGSAGQDLHVLGRLGEGSSIATDSIHDCFGITTRAWAEDISAAARQNAAQGRAHA